MKNNKYSTLVSKLLESTRENRTVWQKTARQNEYSTELASYLVTVTMLSQATFSFGNEHTETYAITLVNEEGENMDTQEIQSTDTDYPNVVSLYSEARRTFYKVDDVLDSLIQIL